MYERWHTRTSLERWTAVKLTLFFLLNSFAVPVLAAYLSSNTSSWCAQGAQGRAGQLVCNWAVLLVGRARRMRPRMK